MCQTWSIKRERERAIKRERERHKERERERGKTSKNEKHFVQMIARLIALVSDKGNGPRKFCFSTTGN